MDGRKLEEVSSRQKMWELEGPCCGSGPRFVCERGSECAASHSGCIFFWMLCSSLCEMLFWLKEEEMSHQELTQRLTTVITHVGKTSLFFFSLHLCRFWGLYSLRRCWCSVRAGSLCVTISHLWAISRLQTHGFGQLDSLLLMVWFAFQACNSLKSRSSKSRVSYLWTDLCKIPKHSPSCREVVEKRAWWKDARATAVRMCFVFACDTGIAAYSQRVFFIAIAVSKVLEGARTGSQKLFSMSGLILLFASLQMLVNTGKALYYALASL